MYPRSRFLAGLAAMVAMLLTSSIALGADEDGDGLDDAWEREHFESVDAQRGGGDPDRDGLPNLEEFELGTNPLAIDTDGDYLRDNEELRHNTDPLEPDTDDDGLEDGAEVRVLGTMPLVADTDGGGSTDGAEVQLDGTDPRLASDDQLDQDEDGLTYYKEGLLGTSDVTVDSDADGLPDGQEDADRDGRADIDRDNDDIFEPREGEETDPAQADTDGDGLHDGWELSAYETDPYAPDSDGDGLEDGVEHELRRSTYACLDPAVADSDFDGLADGVEINDTATDPCMDDSDLDGIYDFVERADGTDPNSDASHNPDTDADGLSDIFEQSVTSTSIVLRDTDGDRMDDHQEILPLVDRLTSDPLDGDTDDDGIIDGREGGRLERGRIVGGSSPIAFDTDDDQLSDGLEQGLTTPQQADRDPDATDTGRFLPDRDPSSRTQPNLADTDGDGIHDGREDRDRDGRKDGNETDPSLFDTDADGMDDGWEVIFSSPELCAPGVTEFLDPLRANDAPRDPDGDGLSSLEEYRVTRQAEDELIVNRTIPCDPDTDDDGLDDGTEVRSNYGARGATDPNNPDTDGDNLPDGVEDADHDGAWQFDTETSPLLRDSDGDRLPDGVEDADHDGVTDEDETDPLEPDTDEDGLDDGTEINILGTDPLSLDTDGDGLDDGLEAGVLGDTDPVTQTDPTRADTDNDGLADGIEDADADGALDTGETDPLTADTDRDGLVDGAEDRDGDGQLDDGETDPLDRDTDEGGVGDGVEVREHNTDPRDPRDDWSADPDGDGLTNRQELDAGTDRFNPDTDGDTISDREEVGQPSDPTDTDGDGLIDALDLDSDEDTRQDWEEAGDEDWQTPAQDTDGDGTPDYRDLDADDGGVSDRTEVQLHDSDPTDPSDDGVGWFEGPVTGGAGSACSSSPAGPPASWLLLLLASVVVALRRRSRRASTLWAAAGLAAVICWPAAGFAQHPDARNTGLEANPFRLDPSGNAILATASAETLPHLAFRFGAVGHYLSEPLVIDPQDASLAERALLSERLQVNVSGAIGLYRLFEVGFILPTVPHQDAQYPGFGLGEVASNGLGNAELYAKAVVLPGSVYPVGIALAAPVVLPTATADAYFGENGFSVHPQALVSSTLGPVLLAANMGVRLQPETSLFAAVDGDKLTLKAGAAFHADAWGVGAEFVGATALASPFDNPYETRGEVVVGGHYDIADRFEIRAGVGRGVISGMGAPAFRSFLSLAYHQGDSDDPCLDPPGGSYATVSPEQCPGLDFDDDSFENAIDACPRAPEDVDGFEDKDGCPDLDDDDDGIPDDEDDCPNDPEDADGFADEDGCPDPDNDGDDILDVDDRCPNQAETINNISDEDGCPDDDQPRPKVRVTENELKLSTKLYFESDKAVIKPSSFPLLDEVGRTLQNNPQIELVEIQGFADMRGPSEYNFYLSTERAKVVRHYLIHRAGVAPERLRAAGYGDFTARDETSQEKWAKERRVQFEIIERSDD